MKRRTWRDCLVLALRMWILMYSDVYFVILVDTSVKLDNVGFFSCKNTSVSNGRKSQIKSCWLKPKIKTHSGCLVVILIWCFPLGLPALCLIVLNRCTISAPLGEKINNLAVWAASCVNDLIYSVVWGCQCNNNVITLSKKNTREIKLLCTKTKTAIWILTTDPIGYICQYAPSDMIPSPYSDAPCWYDSIHPPTTQFDLIWFDTIHEAFQTIQQNTTKNNNTNTQYILNNTTHNTKHLQQDIQFVNISYFVLSFPSLWKMNLICEFLS